MNLKISKVFSFLWLAILLPGFVFAQSLSVTGNVKSSTTGQSLKGVSIVVKGSSSGTSTDEQGNFSIKVPKKGSVLVFSNVGYKSQEFAVSKDGKVEIKLVDGATQLDEVVINVGYGTQKVTKVSGAISTVKSADIEKLRPVRTEEALQGRASGVNVIQSGSPGSKPTVLIRGIPSFSGTDPVVIIDGVPQTLTDLNAINAIDIESISVLERCCNYCNLWS